MHVTCEFKPNPSTAPSTRVSDLNTGDLFRVFKDHDYAYIRGPNSYTCLDTGISYPLPVADCPAYPLKPGDKVILTVGDK